MKSMEERKTSAILRGGALVALWLAPLSALAVTKVSRIEFFGKSSPNQIVIVADGPVEFEKIENPADRQVVFELKNARLANANAGRRLDTASFNSKVALISPYNVDGKDSVRVIVQLRENADFSTLAEGSRLFIGIDGAADPNILPANPRARLANGGAHGNAADSASGGAAPEITTTSRSAEVAPSATPEGRIEQFLDASATRRYVGRRITLQVKEADIMDVFKLIGETSGFNMVIGTDVTGKVTLSLVDVPWDLALDTVLTTNRLGAERTGNVLRIAPLATLTAEKAALQQAKLAAENNAPRITRIFPLSYASGASLTPILSRFGGGNAGSGGAVARDTIIVDERTNSLIIQDTADNLERMAKIIKLLDRQTPQVQIEAKIVNATEDFSKAMVGAFGFNSTSPWGSTGGSFLSGLSNPEPDGFPGTSASAAGSNALGMRLKIGALAGLRLSALLSLAESESKNKIISSPRTVVLNKQASTIIQGVPVLVPVTIQTQNGSAASTEVRSANLSLAVTPTVTNDGSVLMNLNISSDTAEKLGDQSGIANRNITTQVVAESGSTIAIGGVYTSTEQVSEAGIPGLRKLPILGALFGSESKSLKRSELFIFVTPRILNEEVMGTEIETQQSSARRASAATVSHGK